MLVLSRKIGERTVITTPDGYRIVMTLVDIRNGDKARMGWDADTAVTIDREEVDEAIHRVPDSEPK
jgi:carbon storage regulator CsrA